jgi:hypothetical protein
MILGFIMISFFEIWISKSSDFGGFIVMPGGAGGWRIAFLEGGGRANPA